jgi:hypothetical protein
MPGEAEVIRGLAAAVPDPDVQAYTTGDLRDMAGGRKTYFGGPMPVLTIRGSGVQSTHVVGVSQDGTRVTVRPIILNPEQKKRVEQTGKASLYDYTVPAGFVYAGKPRARMKLQGILDEIVASATGRMYKPRSGLPHGVEIVALPKDVAGPSILDHLAAKYGKKQ